MMRQCSRCGVPREEDQYLDAHGHADLKALLDAVHCIDNCKGMMLLPDESIDLVVTSPPYDDLRTYGGHSWDFYGVAWNLARVLKPGGVIVWVVNDGTENGSETGTSMEQALHFKRIGLNIHDTMIWNKCSFSQAGDLSVRYGQVFEYCFVFSKGKPNAWNPIIDRKNKQAGTKKSGTMRNRDGTIKPKSNIGALLGETGIRFNVWEMPGHPSCERHPAPFPERLAADHIASWSNKGDIVLDPFMGSGTTAKAAKELGRHYIGFEINHEYVEMCRRRTAQATLGI